MFFETRFFIPSRSTFMVGDLLVQFEHFLDLAIPTIEGFSPSPAFLPASTPGVRISSDLAQCIRQDAYNVLRAERLDTAADSFVEDFCRSPIRDGNQRTARSHRLKQYRTP